MQRQQHNTRTRGRLKACFSAHLSNLARRSSYIPQIDKSHAITGISQFLTSDREKSGAGSLGARPGGCSITARRWHSLGDPVNLLKASYVDEDGLTAKSTLCMARWRTEQPAPRTCGQRRIGLGPNKIFSSRSRILLALCISLQVSLDI